MVEQASSSEDLLWTYLSETCGLSGDKLRQCYAEMEGRELHIIDEDLRKFDTFKEEELKK